MLISLSKILREHDFTNTDKSLYWYYYIDTLINYYLPFILHYQKH